jgi:hypothetical protein
MATFDERRQALHWGLIGRTVLCYIPLRRATCIDLIRPRQTTTSAAGSHSRH